MSRYSHSLFPCRSLRGFTLLEICLVLFIILLVMAAAIPATSSYIAEQQLRAPVRELVLLAKTARRQAAQESRPYRLTFTTAGFRLEPATTLVPPSTPPLDEEEKAAEFEPVDYRLPSGMTLTLRRWGAEKWSKPADDTWTFQDTGLCEPLSFRFTRGEAWIEIDFNPLTAEVGEERYHFP